MWPAVSHLTPASISWSAMVSPRFRLHSVQIGLSSTLTADKSWIVEPIRNNNSQMYVEVHMYHMHRYSRQELPSFESVLSSTVDFTVEYLCSGGTEIETKNAN